MPEPVRKLENHVGAALGWIHRHKRWGWLLLLIYAPLVTFPHDVVQDYVAQIANRYTHKRLYQGAAVIGIAIGVLVTVAFFRAVRRFKAAPIVSKFWILTLALIVTAWSGFMANNVEIVHFPQYFPEGVLLLALTGSAMEAVAWGTFFGGLDECFQYWFLVRGKPVPYDFNDIFMDLLGTAAGVVFALSFLRLERRNPKEPWSRETFCRPGTILIAGVVALAILLWAGGLMTLYEAPGAPPHWFSLSRQTKLPFWFSIGFLGPRTFHELSPVEGPLVNLAGIALYSLITRRYRIAVVPAEV